MKNLLLICLIIASFTTSVFADSKPVLGPDSLGYLTDGQRKYPFCPNDTEHSDSSFWGGLILLPCVLPGVTEACIAAGAIALGAEAVIGDSSSPIGNDAVQTCSTAPAGLKAYQVPYWKKICQIVVDSANRNAAANANARLVPAAKPPLKMSDQPLLWYLDGQPVEQVESLRLARQRLRDWDNGAFTSCMSDSQFVNALKANPKMTLQDVVALNFNNIEQYGGRMFGRPLNNVRTYYREAMLEQARLYIVSRTYNSSQMINEFDGLNPKDWNYFLCGVPIQTAVPIYSIKELDNAANHIIQTNGADYPPEPVN